jgi:15-cis-phytoene synthase
MVGFLEIRETKANAEECRLYTRSHAKTFYFASHVLPLEKRNAAYAVYAFCRYADNIVDIALFPEARTHAAARLNALRDQLRFVYSFSPLMDRRLLAFREAVFTYQIPQEYFSDLLRGVEMDLAPRRFASFAELKEYCYCVASVVGLIMARIFGVTDAGALAHASDLGTAMQLTNILRDVGEDLRMGRVYIPDEDLRAFGVSDDDLAAGRRTIGFTAMMKFEIERARHYYAEGARGIPALPGDGSRFCVRLMSRTYARILDSIEMNEYDVFGRRASVSPLGKSMILAGVLLGTAEPAYRPRSDSWEGAEAVPKARIRLQSTGTAL